MNSKRTLISKTGIVDAGAGHWRGYPSRNLTPAGLSAVLRELDAGYTRTAMELFDEMEEKDLHLATVMQTRVSAAASLPRKILPAGDDGTALKHADFIRSVWERLEGKTRLLHDILMSIGRGFSISEIMYEPRGDDLVATRIKFCPQSLFSFADPDKPGAILDFPLYLPYGETKARKLPRDKFIFHTHRESAGGPLRGGLYRGLAWYYLFTNYSIKDWMSFMDLYGIPLRIGKFKPSADEKSRDILRQAVRNLGSDAAAVISEDTTIEFIESKLSGGHDLFQSAVEFFNFQKSKRVLGQTLTTEQGKTGSYSLGAVHDRVRHDIIRFDCASLDETLTRDLIIPLVKANFGEQKRYPRFVTDADDYRTRTERLDDLKKLHDMGVPVSLAELYRTAGIGEPSATENVLTKEGVK